MQYVLCRIEDDGSSTYISEHTDLLDGLRAGKHMVGEVDHDYAYGLYTDEGIKLTTFAMGRIGYREWAHRNGRLAIHSVDDRYDHDIDEVMSR